MLPAFLPSWIQDFPGVLMMSTMSHGLNGAPVSLLLVLLVLAIAGLWLLDRVGAGDRMAARVDQKADAVVHERSSLAPQLTQPDPSQVASTMPPLAVQIQSALVLVVDDSTSVRAKLRRLLTSAGYRVAEAGDGHQAWELLQSGELPAVMITDLEMPVLDGFELIAAVHGRVETEHLPIIAITGKDDLRTQVADLAGIYGIFKKPWNDRELVRRVDALVALSVQSGSATVGSAAH